MLLAAPPAEARRWRSLRWRTRVLLGVAAVLLVWLAGSWWAARLAMAQQCASIPPIAILAGRAVTDVATTADDGVSLRGWSVSAAPERVVILLAGYGGDRRSLLGPARCYLSRGWSVLLPDLRATGESGGDQVGFGYPERRDVAAWVAFARQRGATEIGLHGQSLGAAAICYCRRDHPLAPAFVVLDSCYDDIRNALHNRLPWLPLAGLLTQPVLWFGAVAMGTSPDALRPIDCVARLRCPVLFVAGDRDRKVLPKESRGLFAACRSERKLLRWIAGGRHENLWHRSPQAYAAAIDAMFASIR